MLPDSLLESSTKILYSIENLSGEIKLHWSKYLSYSFPGFTQAQKRQTEILLASRPLMAADAEFNALNDQDKIWVLASFKNLADHAVKIEDWISNREITLLVKRLTPEALQTPVKEEYAEIGNDFREFENRKVFVIDGSIALFFCDFFLRWVALFVCNSANVDSGTLLLLNFFAVPVIVLSRAVWRFRLDRQHNQSLVAKAGYQKLFKVRFAYTGLQYFIVAFFLVTGLFTAFLLVEIFAFNVAITIFLLLYYLFLFNILPVGRLTEYGLLQQIHSKESMTALDADSNDEAIVSVETQINASTSRLEAYVLESALFGALAFSGFLQIIATDLITFTDLEKFAANTFHASQSLLTARWTEFEKYYGLLNNEVSLFCLVSIETLICSALFLAVIAARLRFSDVADKVRTSLNLAKAYNEKEEQILQTDSGEGSRRLRAINEKIYDYVTESHLQLRGITPIVSYMVYFRNAGLATFLAVLITSSLFVSSFLGWCFIATGLITVIYFNLKPILSALSSFGFHFQIFFARYSKVLIVVCIVPAVLAFIFRLGFHWFETDFLVSITFLLVGTYAAVWFTFMPHVDNRFGDIENLQNEAWRSSGWRLIKNIYGALILISFLGFSLKFSHIKGSDEMLLIGLCGLSAGAYFIGFYLTRPRWLGVIVGMLFGTAGIGTLFKILHLEGANQMTLVAACMTPIFFAMYFFRRRSFHFILLRIGIVLLTLIIFYSPFLAGNPSRKLATIYEYGTMSIAPIVEFDVRIWQDIEPAENFDPRKLDESIKACDEYMVIYGSQYGYTDIYRQFTSLYRDIATTRLSGYNKNHPDTTDLDLALRAVVQLHKIHAVFNYRWLEWEDVLLQADALEALAKKEELRLFLTHIAANAPDEEIKANAKRKLSSL